MTTLIATIVAVASSLLRRRVRGRRRGAARRSIPATRTLSPSLRSLAERRERPHRALAFARVLAHLVAGLRHRLSARAFSDRSLGVSLLIAVPLALVAVLVVREHRARASATRRVRRTLERLAPVVRAVERVLSPVVVVGTWLDNILHSLDPADAGRGGPRGDGGAVPPDRRRGSGRHRAEETLIHGVFSLGDTAVHEVMVPRVDIVGIERETPWSEVLARVRSSEHARFPVFEDTLDEIVGILYAKDLLPAVIADEEPPGGWASLVRPPVFIPASKRIDEQLRDFQSSRTHIAVVVDEYGGTAGLVTIEDVLEEIVGEIRDEYDDEEAAVEQEEGRRFWVPGRLTLDELSELVGARLPARGRHDRRRPRVRAARPRAATPARRSRSTASASSSSAS